MHFDWDPAKNEETIQKHGISFEKIVALVSKGGLIKTAINPSPKYPGQKVMVVRKGKAVYMVPYEKRGDTHWLITVFYSEFLTKKYLRLK
jgi:uncharacterized DUF497 family protein